MPAEVWCSCSTSADRACARRRAETNRPWRRRARRTADAVQSTRRSSMTNNEQPEESPWAEHDHHVAPDDWGRSGPWRRWSGSRRSPSRALAATTELPIDALHRVEPDANDRTTAPSAGIRGTPGRIFVERPTNFELEAACDDDAFASVTVTTDPAAAPGSANTRSSDSRWTAEPKHADQRSAGIVNGIAPARCGRCRPGRPSSGLIALLAAAGRRSQPRRLTLAFDRVRAAARPTPRPGPTRRPRARCAMPWLRPTSGRRTSTSAFGSSAERSDAATPPTATSSAESRLRSR